jgi:indolepyruvate ferredoxin oxidoreductase
MGFAQKGGTVLSYLRLAQAPAAINQVRIDHGMARAMIACDLLVGTDPRALNVLARNATRVLANVFETPSADFVLDRDADMGTNARLRLLREAVGAERLAALDANTLAERLLGHSVYSNVLMLGCAWQMGLVPVSRQALARAMELNGVSVATNQRAFDWGRLAAVAPEEVALRAGTTAKDEPAPKLDDLLARRSAFLREYQDTAWAQRYADAVARVRALEHERCGSEVLATAVAHNLFRLMSYKDEYEVARLFCSEEFTRKLQDTFEGDYRLSLNLAPPLLGTEKDAQGRPKKREFGPWMLAGMRWLRHGKRWRGTPFDPFGWLPDRRLERALIAEYEVVLAEILGTLDAAGHATALQLAALPSAVRGFGPVKEQAVARMRAERERLLADWRAGRAPVALPTAVNA